MRQPKKERRRAPRRRERRENWGTGWGVGCYHPVGAPITAVPPVSAVIPQVKPPLQGSGGGGGAGGTFQ